MSEIQGTIKEIIKTPSILDYVPEPSYYRNIFLLCVCTLIIFIILIGTAVIQP